jgi:hypothetical protein
MFIELIDVLRCTRAHEESWLVGAFDEVQDRDVIRGRLGCPVCHAEYPIERGTVHFDVGPRATLAVPAGPPGSPDETLRLAAMLGLAGAGGVVLLGGGWGAYAESLEQLVPARYVAINPAGVAPLGPSGSVLMTAGTVPLGAGSVRGAALDERTLDLAPGALRALATRGRLVAPASSALPSGVAELARDERHWVAERGAAASAPVALRTRARD